jgi:hypothetical protein
VTASFQESSVTGEHDAALGLRARGDRGVVEGPLVDRVEAEEPKVAGELSQVHVGDELRIAQGHGAQPGEGRDVEPLEGRIDGDALAAHEAVVETDGLAVDEDDVDLRVGHAERLHDVFHGGRAVEPVQEAPLLSGPREEVVELLVEAELAAAQGHPASVYRPP